MDGIARPGCCPLLQSSSSVLLRVAQVAKRFEMPDVLGACDGFPGGGAECLGLVERAEEACAGMYA